MPCYQSIKTLEGKIPPRVFYFVSLFFPNPIIARWASQGCQGSSLASLAPMNGRLRLPPLTAFAHLAYISNKERKGKKEKEISMQHSNHQQKPKKTTIWCQWNDFYSNPKHRQCHKQRLMPVEPRKECFDPDKQDRTTTA